MITQTPPTEILLENFSMSDHWGTVELIQTHPIINHEHWAYVCDPMEVNLDQDVVRKITCISETNYDPWFRKMIPWKWRNFEEVREWDLPTPHSFLNGKKTYALSERYTSVNGKHIRLYKREYNFILRK